MAESEAPGGLELVRQFVNTIDLEQGRDPLEPDRLEEWCRQNGFAEDLTREEVVDLCVLREAVRSVLESHAGEGEEQAGMRALQPFADRSGCRFSVSEQGTLALEPAGSRSEAVIDTVLVRIYDAERVGTWSRLKACRKHSCRWAFYDRSKNGSGAWCSMAVCGNRVKAQRRRVRSNAPRKVAAEAPGK